MNDKIKTMDYPPEPFVGNPKNCIWIIGLNPKGKPGDKYNGNRERYFENGDYMKTRYYINFKSVSSLLWDFICNDKIAHTDIINEYSEKFSDLKNSNNQIDIEILKNIIQQFKPKIIVCNGKLVCETVKKLFPPNNNENKLYITNINGSTASIILTSFVGGQSHLTKEYKKELGKRIEDQIAFHNLT